MKTLFIIIGVLCVLGIAGHAWYSNKQFHVPALHTRAAGLLPAEFAKQQQVYNQLVHDIKQSPEVMKNYTLLAKLFMSEARVSGDHPYYYPAAMTVLDYCLSKDKRNLEASLLKTSVLLSLHHFAEAREMARTLTSEHSNISALYGMLCDAEVELGNIDDALQAADVMMQLRPGLDAYARVAYLREIHGDVEGALQAMTMAADAGLAGTEDAAWTRTTLGSMYLKYGRLQEAQRCFERARVERQNYPAALAGLAMVLHERQQDASALTLLDSALALQPEVSFMENKAVIMRGRGQNAQSDSLMHIVETMLDEDESAGHINDAERALAYCKVGYKVKEALNYARKEIRTRPNNMTAQYAMAAALRQNAQYKEAQTYIQRALQRGSQDPDMKNCAALLEQSLQHAEHR